MAAMLYQAVLAYIDYQAFQAVTALQPPGLLEPKSSVATPLFTAMSIASLKRLYYSSSTVRLLIPLIPLIPLLYRLYRLLL